DLDQLRDGEQVEHLLVRLQNLDHAAFLDRALVARDELSDPRAVHERDLLEIHDELLLPLVEEVLDRLPHLEIAGPVGDAAGKIDDTDVRGVANDGMHSHSLQKLARASRSSSKISKISVIFVREIRSATFPDGRSSLIVPPFSVARLRLATSSPSPALSMKPTFSRDRRIL